MSTLKTFGKNLNLTIARTFWKQFVEWVTVLRNRYWQDAFFRTQTNIIALQISFAAVLLIIMAFLFNDLYNQTLATLLNNLEESIPGSTGGQEILRKIEDLRTRDFIYLFAIGAVITVMFSYIIARVTLIPAKQALRSQKRFISDIAHELRTPLAVIKTNTEVALFDPNLEDSILKIFKSNIEELDRASEIINNLLTFNNLLRPEKIKFSSVDVSVSLDRAVKNLRKLAQNKNIRVYVKKIPPYSVWANAGGLEQIFSNILKNALSYTPPNGTVHVLIEPDYKNNVMVRIEDTGIGIPEKDLLHIFEPFYRAETSRNRQSGASGLGLAIVSELLKLHNGKITIKSRPTQGTIVTVLLPYATAEKKEDSIWNVLKKEGKDSIDEVSIDFLKK